MEIMVATEDQIKEMEKEPWTMIQIFKSLDMVTESSTGPMALTTKDNGISTKRRAKVLSGMPRVTFIKASLRMIWPMDMASIHILTALNTKVNSKTMSRKATAKKNGLTEPSTLAHT